MVGVEGEMCVDLGCKFWSIMCCPLGFNSKTHTERKTYKNFKVVNTEHKAPSSAKAFRKKNLVSLYWSHISEAGTVPITE